MAKGRKTSFAVRAVALVFAVALAALAAKLWLGPKPMGRAAPAVDTAPRDDAEAELSGAPPQHGEMSDADRDALREILRDSQGEPP